MGMNNKHEGFLVSDSIFSGGPERACPVHFLLAQRFFISSISVFGSISREVS
jgi:hypothetical protein